jgi:hypothetical protein
LLCILSLVFLAQRASAQERPTEDELFKSPGSAPERPPVENAPPEGNAPPGETAAESTPTTTTASAPASADAARDANILGATSSTAAPKVASPESTSDDPLRIGGMIYLSAYSTVLKGQAPAEAAFGAPSLLDVYLDARPNDRVRGFVLGRMEFDLTQPDNLTGYDSQALSSSLANSRAATNVATLPGAGSGPVAALDQLWLRFDVARRVFVTAGKQHVRWGTGQVWIPTDYLHLRKKNPLNTVDARTGTTMIKLHLPIESKSWNFYAYGILESTSSALGGVAAAARAEFTFDTTELALGAFARRGEKPKFAAELSTGLGDFDVYGEVAVLDASSKDRVRYDANATIPPEPDPPSWESPAQTQAARLVQVVDLTYPTYRDASYRVQAVGGVSYARRYNDNDSFVIGVEYFYNQLGYGNSQAYPGLFLPHSLPLQDAATFFYLGRHYAALSLSLPSPFSLDLHSFRVSTLGNFSDTSFITRLDYNFTLLTHLTFEAFASVRYGKTSGEFRFGVGPVDLGGTTLTIPPTLADFGIALRMSL